jgi:hypothetical protein
MKDLAEVAHAAASTAIMVSALIGIAFHWAFFALAVVGAASMFAFYWIDLKNRND